MKTIYYSFRVGEEKNIDLDNFKHNIVFGKAHYSYKIAAKKFLNILKFNGYNIYEIIRPEIYKHPLAFDFLPDYNHKKSIHLIFKPIEEINILKNSKNIGIFAWEFDKITTSNVSNNPFTNQKHMLSLLDEIWVPSTYTKDVLNDFGFNNVYFIPAPIKEPEDLCKNKSLIDIIGSFISVKVHPSPINKEKLIPIRENINFNNINKTYFSILNPWDYRKNLPKLIDTFRKFSKKHQDTLLIIKVIIDNKSTFLNNINEILYKHFGMSSFKSDNIIMISEYIPEKELYSIMQKVDYYYSLSFCEGQFLPILESMIVGTVPISPNSTAMRDYITKENALVIDSKPTTANPKSNGFAVKNFIWYEPNYKQALLQLEKSYNLSPKTYKQMSLKGRTIIQSIYSENTILNKIKERLDG
jgi:glycosyltransferase involved in cell wall biosynthesis